MKRYERKWKHICLKRQATVHREHASIDLQKAEKTEIERKKSSAAYRE
ncbi:hypothetical protein [Ectobacillus sp. sgz5001026]